VRGTIVHPVGKPYSSGKPVACGLFSGTGLKKPLHQKIELKAKERKRGPGKGRTIV